jgi:hypothetical protein
LSCSVKTSNIKQEQLESPRKEQQITSTLLIDTKRNNLENDLEVDNEDTTEPDLEMDETNENENDANSDIDNMMIINDKQSINDDNEDEEGDDIDDIDDIDDVDDDTIMTIPNSLNSTQQYEPLNTSDIAQKVRDLLSQHNIGQRIFAKFILGLSQGTVSELLSKPKHWDKLTEKGRESYRKMYTWANSDASIAKLKTKSPRKGSKDTSNLSFSYSNGVNNNNNNNNSDHLLTEEKIVQILNEATKKQHLHSPNTQKNKSRSRSISPINNNNNNNNNSQSKYESITQQVLKHLQKTTAAAAAASASASSSTSTSADKNHLFNGLINHVVKTQQRMNNSFYNEYDNTNNDYEDIENQNADDDDDDNESTFKSSINNKKKRKMNDSTSAFSSSLFPLDLTVNKSLNNTNYNKQHQQLFPNNNNNKIKSEIISEMSEEQQKQFLAATAVAAAALAHAQQNNNNSQSFKNIQSAEGAFCFNANTKTPSTGNILYNQSSPTSPLLFQRPTSTPSPSPSLSSNSTNIVVGSGGNGHKPLKSILPPVSQEQFDKYSFINTEDLVKKVKDLLSKYSISQRLFGECILGLSQGSVSDLLARPKPWMMLTQKGREPFIRMQMFIDEPDAIRRLIANQYKTPETTSSSSLKPIDASPTSSSSNRSITQSPVSNILRNNQQQQQATILSSMPSILQQMQEEVNNNNNIKQRKTLIDQVTGLVANMNAEKMNLARNSPLYQLNQHQHHFQQQQQQQQQNNSKMSSISTSTFISTDNSSNDGNDSESVKSFQNQMNIIPYDISTLSSLGDLNTEDTTNRVKETLLNNNIGQKLFGEAVLNLSQGTVSELLSKPKPWNTLSIKGREPYLRMFLWLNDSLRLQKLLEWKEEKNSQKRNSTTEISETDQAKPKRRFIFTDEQKEKLIEAFNYEPYPAVNQMEELATTLNLATRTVINWFHNHRMRQRFKNPNATSKEATAAALVASKKHNMNHSNSTSASSTHLYNALYNITPVNNANRVKNSFTLPKNATNYNFDNFTSYNPSESGDFDDEQQQQQRNYIQQLQHLRNLQQQQYKDDYEMSSDREYEDIENSDNSPIKHKQQQQQQHQRNSESESDNIVDDEQDSKHFNKINDINHKRNESSSDDYENNEEEDEEEEEEEENDTNNNNNNINNENDNNYDQDEDEDEDDDEENSQTNSDHFTLDSDINNNNINSNNLNNSNNGNISTQNKRRKPHKPQKLN